MADFQELLTNPRRGLCERPLYKRGGIAQGDMVLSSLQLGTPLQCVLSCVCKLWRTPGLQDVAPAFLFDTLSLRIGGTRYLRERA